MSRQLQEKLMLFIERELKVAPEAIARAQKQVQFPSQLPVSLWHYGVISLEGVNQIWRWIEAHPEIEGKSKGTTA